MSRIAINAMAMGHLKTGVGRFISELVDAMARSDEDHNYLVFTTPFGQAQLHLDARWQVSTPVMPLPVRLVWEQTVLPALLRRHHIDLYHGQGFTIPLLKLTASVVTIYDMTWFSHSSTHELTKTLYFRAMIPPAVRHAERVLAISESTSADICARFPEAEDRVVTTPGGVAQVFFDGPDDPNAADEVLARYEVRQPYILSVGMIQPRKNLSRLIQAMHRLESVHGLKRQLVVVGKQGWKNDELFSVIDQAGMADRITFTGFVPDEDLVHLYRRCEVFAYPSLYEGFGLPVVEAMAAGAPVLTSDCSSLREVAGNAAELCDPESVESIAGRLAALIRAPAWRGQLIERGFRQARAFSWDETARRTLAAYTDALNERGRMG